MQFPIFFSVFLIFTQISFSKHLVLVTSYKEFVLLRSDGVVRAIPDNETVSALGFSSATLSTISDDILGILKRGGPVPSLIQKDISPDEQMRVKVQTALALEPHYFWRRQDTFFIPNRINPSLAVWHDKLITSSRFGDIYHSKIKFGWMDKSVKTLSVNDDTTFVGISSRTQLKSFEMSILQEDPRMLVMKNGDLVIAYTAKHDIMSNLRQTYSVGRMDNASGLVIFDDPIFIYNTTMNVVGKKFRHV